MKREDIANIKNLIVRRALMSRFRDFKFNYGDYSEKSHTDSLKNDSPKRYNDAWKRPYKDHTDHVDSPRYEDYDRYGDTYRDYGDYERN